MKLIFLILLLTSTSAYADLEYDKSFDLGISLSPSFTPEGGYSDARFRFGIELGFTFFKFENEPLVSAKGITKSRTTSFKLLRVGVGVIDNQPVATFSPIAVRLQDRLYLSPTFGFGKDPHTIFSISYNFCLDFWQEIN